ncbi:MAG TPA: acyl carrier protein [Bradyrhizobium sp.]|nr:acyl carrier protein [Bradyrhizobium sp.]
MEHLSEARSILARALNVTADTIGDRATIDALESWDSLGHMRLVLEIEQHLKRELSPMEIVELASLADVQNLLASSDRMT